MKRLWGMMVILMLAIFLAACGNEERDGDEVGAEQKETDTAKEEEAEKAEEAEEEPAIPEDEELFAVLEENLKAMQEKDLDKYMETIHSDSPDFASTETTMEQLFIYDLDLELSGLAVEEKTEEEARVYYEQTSIKVDGPEFQNNLSSGVHILKPDDGVWKIFGTEIRDVVAVDEDGNAIDQAAEGAAVMEGQYADTIMQLDIPFEGEAWELGFYEEAEGEAIAEFIPPGESVMNYSKLFTIHYFQDGIYSVGPADFAALMEEELNNVIGTGDLEFNTLESSETETIYEFGILGDNIHADQEELARVFVKDTDLYSVRYTTMGENIEDKEQWIEDLKSIQ